MRKNRSPLVASLILILWFAQLPTANAIQTLASFDFNYAITSLTVATGSVATATSNPPRTLTSDRGFEANYNVALFNYKTVVSISFAEFFRSSLGNTPLTRIAFGGSYHFIHVNGQRILLDNQVEGKQWGISPAIELTAGITKLSIADSGTTFTASFIDVLPRALLEIPLNSSLLLLIRAGFLTSISGGGKVYTIKYSGAVYEVGLRLTTL